VPSVTRDIAVADLVVDPSIQPRVGALDLEHVRVLNECPNASVALTFQARSVATREAIQDRQSERSSYRRGADFVYCLRPVGGGNS
jgi:hypothetical protein